MAGRKEDSVWQFYIKKSVSNKTGCRAICKNCKTELQGIVQRLKRHHEVCNKQQEKEQTTDNNSTRENNPTLTQNSVASTSTAISSAVCGEELPSALIQKKRKLDNQSTMSSFLVRTSTSDIKNIDKQIAKAMFATNYSFRCIENFEVKKAIQLLRPGYDPPSRKIIGTTLLNEIYDEEKIKCSEELYGKSVCLTIDGWSNVHNEPIICAVVTTEEGKTYLVESIDTSGHSHTADYLTDVVTNLIQKCKNEYNCKVTTLVTDNAANMNKMRENVTKKAGYLIVTYGCSAHILNLLSKDLEIKGIKEHVVHIVKYFRNNHFASALYKEKGGKKLVLPQDVRWNTLSDCIEIYLAEWPKLFEICEDNRTVIDTTVAQKVSNLQLKRLAEDFLKILKPISMALDKLQKSDALLSYAVETWKELEQAFDNLEDTNLKQIGLFKKRYEQAVTPFHFLPYIMDPTKKIFKLTNKEIESALQAAAEHYPGSGLLPLVIQLQAESDPFKKIMFSDEILECQCWTVVEIAKNRDSINNVLDIVMPLLHGVASSASVERIFSSFGLVQSKLRNRLGTEKAVKLVFLFKYYNSGTDLQSD